MKTIESVIIYDTIPILKEKGFKKMTIYQLMSAYGFIIKVGLMVLMGLYLIWFIPTAKKYIKKSNRRGKK